MFGWQEIMIVTVLLVLLFGRGKISDLMGDVAQGIKSFKQNIKDDDKPEEATKTATNSSGQTIEHNTAEKVNVSETAPQSEQKAG